MVSAIQETIGMKLTMKVQRAYLTNPGKRMGMQKLNPDRIKKMIGYEHLLEGQIPQKVASQKVILNSFESDLVERNEKLAS
jgi:hypothetical protein